MRLLSMFLHRASRRSATPLLSHLRVIIWAAGWSLTASTMPTIVSPRGANEAARGPCVRLSGWVHLSPPPPLSQEEYTFGFEEFDDTKLLFTTNTDCFYTDCTCRPPGSGSCGSSSPGWWPPVGTHWGGRCSHSPARHRPADGWTLPPQRCPPPPEKTRTHTVRDHHVFIQIINSSTDCDLNLQYLGNDCNQLLLLLLHRILFSTTKVLHCSQSVISESVTCS